MQAPLLIENQRDPTSIDRMIDIRARLREAVEASRLSQREVAKRTGLQPQRLNNYLQRGTVPDADVIVRLCEALSISSDWLLGLSDPAPTADIAPIIERLLTLYGIDGAVAEELAAAAVEAQRVATALPNEGDAGLRSRLAAQTVWQSKGGPRLN